MSLSENSFPFSVKHMKNDCYATHGFLHNTLPNVWKKKNRILDSDKQ